MNNYQVRFDFTTAHRNGRFVGRSGQVALETEDSLEMVNENRDEVKNLCVQFIHHQKPKWNILMLTVKEILLLNSEPKDKRSVATESESGNKS